MSVSELIAFIIVIVLILGFGVLFLAWVQETVCRNCRNRHYCDRHQHDKNFVPPCQVNRMKHLDPTNPFNNAGL